MEYRWKCNLKSSKSRDSWAHKAIYIVSLRDTSGAEANLRVCEQLMGVRSPALEALFTKRKTSRITVTSSGRACGDARGSRDPEMGVDGLDKGGDVWTAS